MEATKRHMARDGTQYWRERDEHKEKMTSTTLNERRGWAKISRGSEDEWIVEGRKSLIRRAPLSNTRASVSSWGRYAASKRMITHQVFHSSFENAFFDSRKNNLELFSVAESDRLKSAWLMWELKNWSNDVRSAGKMNNERSCSFISI